jgi:hypothetical protein
VNELATALDEIVADAPVDEASWGDVLARARRPRRRRAAALGLGAVVAIAVAAPAFGIQDRVRDFFGGEPVGSERLSAEELHSLGRLAHALAPRVAASEQENLARVAAASLRRIATRGDRAYYVADLRGGGLCVSIGALDGPRLLGSISCSPDFPPPERPIYDESTFRGPIARPYANRLEGFAADGVASVGFLTVDGDVAAVTPVRDNVYLRTEGLPEEPVGGFVAFDANGARIYDLCFVAAACERD